jgi:hypothetical protein
MWPPENHIIYEFTEEYVKTAGQNVVVLCTTVYIGMWGISCDDC